MQLDEDHVAQCVEVGHPHEQHGVERAARQEQVLQAGERSQLVARSRPRVLLQVDEDQGGDGMTRLGVVDERGEAR